MNQQETLELGSLDSKRDWGHARDFVEAMWLMLQLDSPEDFVIATGKCFFYMFDDNLSSLGEVHTVREFAELAFHEIGQELVYVFTDLHHFCQRDWICLCFLSTVGKALESMKLAKKNERALCALL